MRKSVRCAMRILMVPVLGFAQAAAALSLLDIIEMSRNGYSESEIGRIVDVTGARFEIDAVGMVALREAEVADALVERMLDEGGLPPNEVSEMTAKELLELHEAGFSEGTLLKYVRHRNVCALLSEDGVHLLEREEFSAGFFDAFAELVAACEREQVARAPIEPLPEGAYAGVRGAADDPSDRQSGDQYHHDTQYNTHSTTVYHYDHYGYDRYHDYYHPAFLYSYYHYDPRRRVYPIYLYRDHRAGNRRAHDRRERDRQGRRQRPSPRDDVDAPEERSDPGAPRTASRLFDKPRPYMGGRPGSASGGALPSDSPRNRSRGTVPVPGGPLLQKPTATSAPAATDAVTPRAGTPAPRVPAIPGVPGAIRVQAPERSRAATPSPVVPRAPALRTGRPTRVVPAVPGSTPRSVPDRRRHAPAPVRATPRVVSPRPATRPVPAPRAAPNATPARPVAVPRSVAPRPAPARRTEAVRRSVVPRSPAPVAPRRVTPSRSAPRVVAPAPVAPRAVAPRAQRPRAVAPRAVAPRTPAPRAAAPRAVAPRAAPPSRAVPQRRVAPRPPRQAAPRMPRQGPRVTPPPPKRRVER